MKKVRLLSIQSVVLFLLVVFVFYQWSMLSRMENEKQIIETHVHELKKNENQTKKELERVQKEQDNLLKENETLKMKLSNYIDERDKKKIAYLTFDDGPSKTTEQVLQVLKKYKVPATFFVNGNNSDFAKKLYKDIVSNGHVIGNHTYSHDYGYIYKNEGNFLKDVTKLNDFLANVTGKKPTLIRFPGGSNNEISIQYGGKKLMHNLSKKVEEEGYIYVDWNVDSSDASGLNVSANKITASVLNGSKGKQHAIILMHDAGTKQTTAQALPKIIEGLKKQGFEFRILSEYSPKIQF